MPASFRITGLGEMEDNIKAIAAELPNQVAAALYLEGQIIMTESKRLVPVDTGVLRASGFVGDPLIIRSNIRVVLSYGGAAETYAIIVHEDLQAHHPHGQAKYLEQPMNNAHAGLAARLAARIKL